MLLDPSIPMACRVLGTLVFAGAASGKLRHYTEFTGVVANYRLLPQAASPLAAPVVIALEAVVALSLVSGAWLEAGALLGCVVLAVFALAMGINIVRGRLQIDCGCFRSAMRQHLRPALLVRNALLIAALAVVALSGRPSVFERVTLLQVLDGAGAGLALFLLYLAGDELLALWDATEAFRRRFT
jgi:hypothetical protein